MDLPQFHLPSPADKLVESLNREQEFLLQVAKEHEKELWLECATDFGTFPAARVRANGSFLRIITIGEDKSECVIIAPVDSCSFMFTLRTPLTATKHVVTLFEVPK